MSDLGSRPRVLVLDDDPMVVRSTERVLRRAFDVTATSSMASAISLARSESFAVFVTDYNLGDVTGFDVARQVLEVAVRAPTIVVFSGVQGDEVPARAAAHGFLFVRKSDGPAVLREAVAVASRRWEQAFT